MDIYFVRHGQTGGNTAHRHQQEDTHLTVLGKEQAKLVADAVAVLKPTHVLVSDRVRAIETAREISNVTDLMPDIHPSITELCRPVGVYGHKHRSARSIWYLFRWYFFGLGDDSCGTAGESYKALRHRITSAQAELAALPEDAVVVVVSHAIYINMFLAHMNNAKKLSLYRAFFCFKNILTIKNASISHVTYTRTVKNKHIWKLISYNITDHLTI